MRANPFAILVSNTDSGPFATHVPVVLKESADQLTIRGHVARANPHWRYLGDSSNSLMIFHGPHAYISPANYETREVVPTWNYGAVHVYGKARTYSAPDELQSMLGELIPTFETAFQQQWDSLSDAYRDRMLSHIVGFEIAVSTVETKFKLSQNRTRNEQQNIIDSLQNSADTAISETARLMGERGLGLKKEQK